MKTEIRIVESNRASFPKSARDVPVGSVFKTVIGGNYYRKGVVGKAVNLSDFSQQTIGDDFWNPGVSRVFTKMTITLE